MPTYAFQCPNGHQFEKFEKMSAKSTSRCPKCGKSARRIISGGAGFVFKGSGFYQTDYKNTSAAPKTDKDSSPKSDSKSEPKADKAEKPAKTETKSKKKADD